MSKHILLVDDSDVCRRVTRRFVETQVDLDVCGEAVDGLEGIEKAKALKPDLIILDLAMPRMNGVEAAFRLRTMMPKVPIVLFTIYDDDVARTAALYMGVNAVVSKPNGGWKLIECVHRLLQAA